MSFILILQVVGLIQGLILSLVLFSINQGNFKANKYLAICLFALSGSMFIHLTDYINSINLPRHEVMVNLISLLYGPLLFLYIKTLTKPFYNFNKKNLLHFLLFTIFLVSSPFFYLIFLIYYKIFLIILNLIVYISITTYIIMSKLLLIKYAKKIKESFSTLDKINLNWLNILLYLFSAIWFTALFMEFFSFLRWDFIWIFVSILMYTTGYFALWQPEIFKIGKDETKEIDDKYQKSSLTANLANQYSEKLKNLIKIEKPYLNSEITLPKLAKMLSISTHHLSQILNQKFSQNFFEFINKYRIEEAKKLIKSPEYKNIKIIEIGYDVGYNSISSFNKSFKHFTSLTPSSYRDKISSNK